MPGHNYGWPLVSTGRNYTGTPVSDHPWTREGMDDPRMFWVPSISPSGLIFYTGDKFKGWKNNAFLGALNGKALWRVSFNQPRQAEQREVLLACSTSACATCSRAPTATSTSPPSANRLAPRPTAWSCGSSPRPVARHWRTVMRHYSVLVLITAAVGTLVAQSPEPKLAFPGQTKARSAPPSAPFQTQVVTDKLTSPWSIAFLPDGTFLVTENGGTMCVVKADGSVSAPIEGVPGVRSVGAEGLHEVVLDPDFARNRMIYFTYLSPPVGEPAGAWPLENLYDKVWAASLPERRAMKIGRERVARARVRYGRKTPGERRGHR